ncbi:MAG TPA: zinc ribbon domain-containing protein [Steroidobacter sp.]|nr:zinc ribbon domain-containing protein [Steroidobacter sp.]
MIRLAVSRHENNQMPFYEYECSACKFYVEALQKISDPPLRKCPSCNKSALKKLVSAPVFRLKGGGWYETDFKSDKEDKRNLADREEPSEGKKDEAKTDAPTESAKSTEKAGGSRTADKSTPEVKTKAKAKPVAKLRPQAKAKTKSKPAAKKKAKR